MLRVLHFFTLLVNVKQNLAVLVQCSKPYTVLDSGSSWLEYV